MLRLQENFLHMLTEESGQLEKLGSWLNPPVLITNDCQPLDSFSCPGKMLNGSFKLYFTVGLYIQIFVLHMIIPTSQTGRKEQKCLCVSPESRFLFEILICIL